MNGISVQTILGLLIPFLGTAAGSACVFFMRRNLKQSVQRALTGFAGGHRYYQGRWGLGLLYTLFCWTGVPLALCVTDFMEVMPIAADEDGMVVL